MTAWLAESFMRNALLAGLAVALMAGPLGAFVVWRRVAYYGDALAHAALLGAALALMLDLMLPLGVFLVGVTVAVALHLLRPGRLLPEDALIGILSHAALALGLLVLALWLPSQTGLTELLLGDLLAVSASGAWLAVAVAGVVLTVLWRLWNPLLALTVSEEIALAEGLATPRARLAHALLLAAALAVALPLVGALLFTALLVLPPAAARALARTPEGMTGLSALAGALSVTGGLWGAWTWDAPSGPAIVLTAFLLFTLFHMAARILRI
jgi:zinc transport system permease protein